MTYNTSRQGSHLPHEGDNKADTHDEEQHASKASIRVDFEVQQLHTPLSSVESDKDAKYRCQDHIGRQSICRVKIWHK